MEFRVMKKWLPSIDNKHKGSNVVNCVNMRREPLEV
jgi:hypothetical protein